MAVREAKTPACSARLVQETLRMCGPTLKKLAFDWQASDKYCELYNFK